MNDAEDIQIHLGDSSTTASVEEKPTPAEELCTYAAPCGRVDDVERAVYVHEAVARGIEEHAASSPGNEVGGVLLGNVYRSGGSDYVRIDDRLAARNAEERRSALTFTHETWKALNAEREARRPDLRIVGWYHTHPGLGVFLSENDQFINRNFFRDDMMLALVVDPVASERAFFQWSGDHMLKLPGFLIFGDASRSNEVHELAARLLPAQRKTPPRPSAAAGTPPEVKVLFTEPGLNLYYALPRPLRQLLGITNNETAPRIGLKSAVIVVLLSLLAYQQFHRNTDLASPLREASVRTRVARSLYNTGDYTGALRAYTEAQVMNPTDPEPYIGQLSALAMETDLSTPSALDQFRYRAGAVLDNAAEHGGRPMGELNKWAVSAPNLTGSASQEIRKLIDDRVRARRATAEGQTNRRRVSFFGWIRSWF